jgi:hypothetical protein
LTTGGGTTGVTRVAPYQQPGDVAQRISAGVALLDYTFVAHATNVTHDVWTLVPSAPLTDAGLATFALFQGGEASSAWRLEGSPLSVTVTAGAIAMSEWTVPSSVEAGAALTVAGALQARCPHSPSR